MSKNATRTTSKTNPKNETQRRTTKPTAITSIAATATGTTKTTATTGSKLKVKQQDSTESDKILKKTTKVATKVTASSRTAPKTSKTKVGELVTTSKRTTPSPTTQTTALRVAKPPLAPSKVKPNAVLDSYHSVTVSSPPQKRRPPPKQEAVVEADALEEDAIKVKQQARARTYSRTLQPEEIVVLKRDSAKQRSALEIQLQQQRHQQDRQLEVKQSVAFDVQFEQAKKSPQSAANESDNYSDDFESYESDFETDASTPEEEDEETESEAEVEDNEKSEPDVEKPPAAEDDEEDSEPTQNPITVIQRDRDLERKLDSGHYEMHSRRHTHSGTNHQVYDSFDTNSMANSEQLDSGISSYSVAPAMDLSTHSTSKAYYGGYVDFISRPVITRRGRDLMRKLRFDQLDYQLFEMKPLSYEGFMQTYGKLNTCQQASQTQSLQQDTECQTLVVHTRTSWTQHPPHYGGKMVLSCSGDAGNEANNISIQPNGDAFKSSLARLEQLHQVEQQRALLQRQQRLSKPHDMERMGVFLQKASLMLGKVLSANGPPRAASSVRQLQTGFLNALTVRRIFGASQLLITVHECPPQSDVYRDDFANLLMVWTLADLKKPLRLLSTWAEVCRVAISNDAPDIIVAGLRDGSVAMWDLRETHSYCSKLDGTLTHFSATQSVVPCLDVGQKQQEMGLDLGAVVDVRSFRPAIKSTGSMGMTSSYLTRFHKDIQYATLNDSGLLTIWTLVETGQGRSAASSNEYSSPWARVRLLQAACCDLRDYLERRLLKRQQSAYEKTQSLFQGNVYSDELLRELNETQTLSTALADQGMQGLRFSGIDTGSEFIYVCTNRNFVLCCTRSLKPERFTRIGLHESRFLFPTSLCVLANENYVAVGLSNGSVMILNCNQRQRQRIQRPITAMPQPDIAPDPETGKSCAIQNIILNERRSFDQQEMEGTSSRISGYDPRPNTALQLLQQPRRAYEQRIFDQQLLLSGTALREHLVQSLVQSNDGWQLFALSNGKLRVYDFHLDREVLNTGMEIRSTVVDIAAASTSPAAQTLLVLDENGQVQMHSLNI